VGEKIPGFLQTHSVPGLPELVGQAEQQHHQRLLVARLHLEDVQTDALGHPRLIDEAVALRLGQGSGDRLAGDPFQLEHESLLFGGGAW
jgi:hypothetical protein